MSSHAYSAIAPGPDAQPQRRQSPPTTSTSQVTVVHNPGHYHASSTQHEPSPSTHQVSSPASILSNNDLYSPQRVLAAAPHLSQLHNVQQPVRPRPAVRFDPAHTTIPMASFQDPSMGMGRDFKDDLARAATVVTPGVDDSPYIQYALDLMTRRQAGLDVDDPHESGISQGSGISYPGVHHIVPHGTPGLFQPSPAYMPQTPAETRRSDTGRSAAAAQPAASPEFQIPPAMPLDTDTAPDEARRQRYPAQFNSVPLEQYTTRDGRVPNAPEAHEPLLTRNDPLPRDLPHWHVLPGSFGSDTGSRNHDLTYKPRILQSASLLLLAVLCIAMAAAIAFCAIWSRTRSGLWVYSKDLYKGDYFVFRILPQMLGAVILIYIQSVTSAAFRIQTLSQLASDNMQSRERALFQPMYLKSFLCPRGVQDWKMAILVANTWVMNFTIPLLSSLFAVTLKAGQWTWATGQGVSWTLVAIYLLSAFSILFLLFTWRRKETGLMEGWDLRCLADFIVLAAQSNAVAKYRGTEVMATRDRMRDWFSGKEVERLGFWDAPESSRAWYRLGVEETTMDEKMSARLWARGQGDNMSVASGGSGVPIAEAVRSRYLPWSFRSNQIVFAAVTAVVVAVALIVVSSISATDIRQGFPPGLEAGPNRAAFSAANFLWTFIPSLIGMLLFLVFQSFDVELRILAPWGELARPDGSRAETSILLDYAAASMPWGATSKAIGNRHWRVAFVSFMAPVFVLIPVLSGGMFIALTVSTTGQVRMFPQMIAFGIMLGLFCLYAIALVLLVPSRSQYRLPHAVTCLAEVLSFCSNEEVRNDPAFVDLPLATAERRDLEARLDCGQEWHRQGRWIFSYGRKNDERLGIKRYSRFTVNPHKLGQYDRRTRGELISQPQQLQHSPQQNSPQRQQKQYSRGPYRSVMTHDDHAY